MLYKMIVKKPFYMPSETSLSRVKEQFFFIAGAIWQIFCLSFGFVIAAAYTAEYFIPDIGNAYQSFSVTCAGILTADIVFLSVSYFLSKLSSEPYPPVDPVTPDHVTGDSQVEG